MKGLTKRQREILDYIQEYIKSNRYSPSYREIMKHFGFLSIASVSKHLGVLQSKGAITTKKNSRRSITPCDGTPQQKESAEAELPFIGHIMGGVPIETFPLTQTLTVPKFLVHNVEKTYVLRAKGDSLSQEMIQDGDLLLTEARSEALAGEIIIGALEDRRTFVKQYFPEGNSVRLITSLSKEETALRHDQLTIHGVLVGLWRLFH
ncbi:LexA repressor [Waddlia chondrophila 2032/99]|uniref:LexA repressor n=1 Tax=Waddlia chondrophila 2032/99 TaxID=765953 RepID=F8LEV8_9BACT|nr:LexA repressor [Waddlia chondrophila 2032/99]